MHKKYLIIFFIIVLFSTFFTGISFAVSPAEQASICAEENLTDNLSAVEDDYKNFHFKNKKDVMNAYLGNPISNYDVDIVNFDEDQDLSQQIDQMGFYKFPVMYDGEVITDLSVALNNNGEWEVVDIGGHMTDSMNEIAIGNDLDLKDCSILWFDSQPYLLAVKEGVQYGALIDLRKSSENNRKKLLNPADLNKQLKIEQKRYQEMIEAVESRDSEELIITGIDSSFESDRVPLIQDSFINRIGRYLAYII